MLKASLILIRLIDSYTSILYFFYIFLPNSKTFHTFAHEF